MYLYVFVKENFRNMIHQKSKQKLEIENLEGMQKLDQMKNIMNRNNSIPKATKTLYHDS